MSMLALSVLPGAVSGLLLVGGFAKSILRPSHDPEDELAPGDIDAGFYLSTGRIVWNSRERRKPPGDGTETAESRGLAHQGARQPGRVHRFRRPCGVLRLFSMYAFRQPFSAATYDAVAG